MNIQANKWEKEKVFPLKRMSSNRCRRNDGTNKITI